MSLHRSSSAEIPLADMAYQRVRDDILNGRLAPGTPLSRRRLAEELGMSSVPISEALTRLENEGVVESRPRAGTRVKIPSPEEIHGRYVVREALETHSARLFAELAGRRERARLRMLARALDYAYRETGPDASRDLRSRTERLHFDFHMFITETTRCRELLAAIDRSRVLLFNWLFSVTSHSALPTRWHMDLADALIEGTPEQAADGMRKHVRYRQEEVIESFRKLSELTAGEGRVVRGPQRRTLQKLSQRC